MVKNNPLASSQRDANDGLAANPLDANITHWLLAVSSQWDWQLTHWSLTSLALLHILLWNQKVVEIMFGVQLTKDSLVHP